MTDVETRPTPVTTETTTPATEEKPVATSTETTESTTESTTNDNNEEPVTTVFHDRINYNVKHPLHNAWTLWFDNPGKKANAQSWSQNLKEIVTVDTVEDFWG